MPHEITTYDGSDWPQVRSIYAEGLKTGHAAFMIDPPSQLDWETTHLSVGRLLARDGDTVIGWGALTAADST